MRAARGWLAGITLGFVAVLVTRGPAAETAAPAPKTTSEERLRRDIYFLASDELEGRGPLTRGIDRAAEHIASELKKAGLKPGGVDGSWYQPFPLNANLIDGPSHLALTGPQGQQITLKEGAQFFPMGLSATGKDAAGVVFAGYGITTKEIKSPQGGTVASYDDYAGLDVAHKVVVLLRGTPATADKDLARDLAKGAAFVAKVANAEKHHAAAVLIVNDRETARAGDDLLDFNFNALVPASAIRLPAFHLKRSVLEAMLPGGRDELEDVEKAIERDGKSSSHTLPGWKASFEVKTHRGKATLRNVVGVLEGSGPLAKETIVVGAHYDHLGWGSTSSLAGLKKMAIHHGADDNGSGTTSILELARRFGQQQDRVGRRLVFITFSGEELGLFGSAHYCREPLFPLDKTAAMYNLDMVGRLRTDKDSGLDKVLTEGSGTAAPFGALLDKLAAKYKLKMVHKKGGQGPSDHASFCSKKVPVLFLWTGYHEDYHRPTDTADKINVTGMRRIVDLSEDAITELATMEKPAFVVVKDASPRPPGGNIPRLGIRPAYDDDGEGVLLDGVADDLPANKAGLKQGDRIVEMAGKPVKGLETYMEILGANKSAKTIEVVVIRKGQRVPFKVKLD